MASTTETGGGLFVRNSTGLVREASALDATIYNAVFSAPVGATLAWGVFFALSAFPGADKLVRMKRARKLAMSALYSADVDVEALRHSECCEWVHYKPKLLPQPHDFEEFGLTKLKPCFISVSS